MRKWSDNIDPATIPDAVLLAERARRNGARRKTFGGGRPVTLKTCEYCKADMTATALRRHKCLQSQLAGMNAVRAAFRKAFPTSAKNC